MHELQTLINKSCNQDKRQVIGKQDQTQNNKHFLLIRK